MIEEYKNNNYWRTIEYDTLGRPIIWEDSTGQKVIYIYHSDSDTLGEVKEIVPYIPTVIIPRRRKYNTWDK